MTIDSNEGNRAIPPAGHKHNKPTRNDAKVEQPALWTTRMETGHEEQGSCSFLLGFQTAENNLESPKQSDKHLVDLNANSQEPVMSDSIAEVIWIIIQLEWASGTDFYI